MSNLILSTEQVGSSTPLATQPAGLIEGGGIVAIRIPTDDVGCYIVEDTADVVSYTSGRNSTIVSTQNIENGTFCVSPTNSRTYLQTDEVYSGTTAILHYGLSGLLDATDTTWVYGQPQVVYTGDDVATSLARIADYMTYTGDDVLTTGFLSIHDVNYSQDNFGVAMTVVLLGLLPLLVVVMAKVIIRELFTNN